jgi:hypothetical protein
VAKPPPEAAGGGARPPPLAGGGLATLLPPFSLFLFFVFLNFNFFKKISIFIYFFNKFILFY